MEPVIDTDNTTLEFRNSLNEVIKSVSLTKNEAEVAPLLIKVRLLLQQGKPSEALDLLMDVVRKTQGDKGVNEIMEKGKQQYHKLCDEEKENGEGGQIQQEQHQSILELQGKGSIIEGAFNDNSSSICEDCHGLIANKRLESHKLLWCPAIINNTATVTTNNSNNNDNTPISTTSTSSTTKLNQTNSKSCGACGAIALLLCSKCKQVNYCSRTCQMSNWAIHKKECK